MIDRISIFAIVFILVIYFFCILLYTLHTNFCFFLDVLIFLSILIMWAIDKECSTHHLGLYSQDLELHVDLGWRRLITSLAVSKASCPLIYDVYVFYI